MRKISCLATLLVVFGSVAMANAGEQKEGHSGSHWSYAGATGPQHWGAIDSTNRACASGVNQSPIDLKDFIEADLQPIVFAYDAQATEIINNGHTIQVNFAPKTASIQLDGTAFELKQFHFHAPSENFIEGRPFAMEAHFVHADVAGNLAVVAVMLQEGNNNASLDGLWKALPKHADGPHALTAKMTAQDLLPASREYYRFNGSLTTPPCTEGVRWLVLKQPVSVSAEQVKGFTDIMGHANNRPLQPVHARPVLQ
ncbi:MAG: carbonic anhydrase [Nitrospirae bacterium]|nr:carbonic anhydrase [Magnetococcales bacterium]